MTASVATAYSETGSAWEHGPARIYDRLADTLIDRCPVDLGNALVLDIGAGTGAASRAAQRKGARVVGVDPAIGMLLTDVDERPPAVLGDAVALPFASQSFDAAVAAFSLNHLVDPAAGLREAARVVRSGGAILASAYALDDHHPVKDAAEAAAARRGGAAPRWYEDLKVDATPRLATVDRAAAVSAQAGLSAPVVEAIRVEFPDLQPADLVAWRMGMAQMAPFVAKLTPSEREAMAAEARDALGADPEVLVRSMILIASQN